MPIIGQFPAVIQLNSVNGTPYQSYLDFVLKLLAVFYPLRKNEPN